MTPPPLEAGGGLLTTRYSRWAAAVLGASLTAVGAVATFVSTNGAGSAALVGAGAALLILAIVRDRLDLLKVGNVEFHLRETVARQLTVDADKLEAAGDTEAARRLREEAERLLMRATPAARRFQELRRTMPPGPERTEEFYNTIVRDAKEYSRVEHPSTDAVRQIFATGDDGERVYALVLMQQDPSVADIDCVLDAVSRSRSAFEQYRALDAARVLVARLGSSDRERLSQAIKLQMRPGRITESTGRFKLAQEILAVTGERQGESP